MNHPAPSEEPPDPMQEALRRDSARIQAPLFDAALHHATMRRIRAMRGNDAARWTPGLAWATALVVLAMCAGIWLSRDPRGAAQRPVPPDFSALLAATRTATAGADFDAASPMPAWMSPTAWLLDPPRLSSRNNDQSL